MSEHIPLEKLPLDVQEILSKIETPWDIPQALEDLNLIAAQHKYAHVYEPIHKLKRIFEDRTVRCSELEMVIQYIFSHILSKKNIKFYPMLSLFYPMGAAAIMDLTSLGYEKIVVEVFDKRFIFLNSDGKFYEIIPVAMNLDNFRTDGALLKFVGFVPITKTIKPIDESYEEYLNRINIDILKGLKKKKSFLQSNPNIKYYPMEHRIYNYDPLEFMEELRKSNASIYLHFFTRLKPIKVFKISKEEFDAL